MPSAYVLNASNMSHSGITVANQRATHPCPGCERERSLKKSEGAILDSNPNHVYLISRQEASDLNLEYVVAMVCVYCGYIWELT